MTEAPGPPGSPRSRPPSRPLTDHLAGDGFGTEGLRGSLPTPRLGMGSHAPGGPIEDEILEIEQPGRLVLWGGSFFFAGSLMMVLLGLIYLWDRHWAEGTLPLISGISSMIYAARMLSIRRGVVIDLGRRTVTTRGRTYFHPAWERHYPLDDFEGIEERKFLAWGRPFGLRSLRLIGPGREVDLIDPRAAGVAIVRPASLTGPRADFARGIATFCGLPHRVA